MHSPLLPHLHPKCVEAIENLNKCHNEHNYLRFVGVCNKYKLALKRCFEMEREERRKEQRRETNTSKERTTERLHKFKSGEVPVFKEEDDKTSWA